MTDKIDQIPAEQASSEAAVLPALSVLAEIFPEPASESAEVFLEQMVALSRLSRGVLNSLLYTLPRDSSEDWHFPPQLTMLAQEMRLVLTQQDEPHPALLSFYQTLSQEYPEYFPNLDPESTIEPQDD